MIKYCIDCKHSKINFHSLECHHPTNIIPAYDKPDVPARLRYNFCTTNRLGGWLDWLLFKSCSKKGYFWEAK
jgi:hypothetical protein